jgi:tetratricopeptide (TPR) repeat protein
MLLLLALAQAALWIDVPFVQQDKNGCGSASVWMVMQYWKQDATPRVEEIHRQLYSEEAGGIFGRDMEKYLQAHDYRTFIFKGEWTDLEEQIAKGRPVIICLERNARGTPLHYVVVAGIDPVQNLVLVNDPARRKLLSMSRAEFEAGWSATENWTLLAVPDIELASSAFREEKLPEAEKYLRSALQTNPEDSYTNEFLATVYFLQNNLESALKYWNRAGKPVIEDIRIDPPLKVNPVLLDRAFPFSRASVLSVDDFRTAQARLEATEVFSRHQMELSPAGDNRFDLTLRAAERNGPMFLSWFRGLPYRTIQPGFFNLGGNAVNVKSMLRWDSRQRRANVSMAGPIKGNPKWGFRVGLDGRDETWVDGPATFRMRKIEAGAHIRSIPSGRWNWTSGVALSQRRFSSALPSGFLLKYSGSATRALLRNPDRRLEVDSSLSFDAEKLFVADRERFARIQNTLSVRWHEMTAQLHAGRIFGTAPFDERFVLGLDRDSDLWLRAHKATRDGFKDASFATRSVVLTNWDFQKAIHETGFLRFSAGPFLDAGSTLNSSRVLVDAGLQLRITVLGALTLNVSCGRSLRDGHKAIYSNIN